MPRVIFRIPYIQGGKKKAAFLNHLTSYIATREGVEKPQSNQMATQKQLEFIEELLREFPAADVLYHKSKVFQNPTAENAHAFIEKALEQNADEIAKKENFVRYLASRPRVEKLSAHGLFTSGDEKVVLSKVAETVAKHEGNVWIPIISLTRADAISTGFDNAERWKAFLESYALTMAKEMKIQPQHFHWYAAFHNERHHPHVHMIIYSDKPGEGYVSQDCIEKLKSGMVKQIFAAELNPIYVEQSKRRDFLKTEGKVKLQKLLREMQTATATSPKMEQLFVELSEKLRGTGGRHVYGYLPPTTKKIVDAILDELSEIPEVATAYDLWYEMRNEVLHSYFDDTSERLPLSQQKEFKSLKNYIIQEVESLPFPIVSEKKAPEVLITKEVPTQTEMKKEPATVQAEAPSFSAQAPKETSAQTSAVASSVTRLLHHMSRIFSDNISPQQSMVGMRTDSKLSRKIREKKIAMGHKADDHEQEMNI